MEIRWEIYHRAENFKLIDAALLWLEIEPTPEVIALPPHQALTMKEQIGLEVDLLHYLFWLDVAERMMTENNISKSEAIRRIFESPSPEGVIERCKKPDTRSESDLVWELRESSSPCRELRGDEQISKRDLLEIARKWAETPKFLFPVNQDNDIPRLANELHPKKRNSYLKLIKGLMQKQGIDPSERGITKQLEGMVTDAGQRLRKDAIGDILKEVVDLTED